MVHGKKLAYLRTPSFVWTLAPREKISYSDCIYFTPLLNNIISLQIKPKENDKKQLFSLQEENVSLKKKIQTLEHDLQSAHKLHHGTKNQLEGELLDLKKKLRDTEAKYSNLAATPPKVSF